MRALVVEDEGDIREMVKETLVDENYLVDACGSSVDGLRLVREKPYDLVVTDLKMPQVSGEAIVMAAASLPESLRPKIIVMTGMLAHGREDYLKSIGVDELLRKPFPLKLLVETCNRMFS